MSRRQHETRKVSWIGVVYFRHHIPYFTYRAAPLRQLLKKGAMWRQYEFEQPALNDFKTPLLIAPLLAYFEAALKNLLHTVASGEGLGTVQFQECRNNVKKFPM